MAPPPASGDGAEPSDRPGDPRTWRRRLLIRCAGAYASCLSAVFLLRVVIAELVFREPVLFKFWDQLTFRLYGAPRSSIHPDIDPFYASAPTLERTLERIGNNLGTVGLGSPTLALVLIGVAAATLAGGTLYVVRRWWTLEDPWRWAGILAAGWSVPAWYAVFFAHTQAPRARDDPSAGAGLRRGRGARHRSGDVPSEDRRTLKSRSPRPEISESKT